MLDRSRTFMGGKNEGKTKSASTPTGQECMMNLDAVRQQSKLQNYERREE